MCLLESFYHQVEAMVFVAQRIVTSLLLIASQLFAALIAH
jgi:hypothetical protein